jgi:hypothetical protein
MKKMLFVFSVPLVLGVLFGCVGSPDVRSGKLSGPKLTSLIVADASQEARLVPDFYPDVTDYIVNVPNVTMGVKVTALVDTGLTATLWGELGIDQRRWGTGAVHAPTSPATGWHHGTWNHGHPILEYFPDGTATVKTIFFDNNVDYRGSRVVVQKLIPLRSMQVPFAAAIPMVTGTKWQASDFTANPAMRNVAYKFVHDRWDPTADAQAAFDNLETTRADQANGNTWKAITEVIYSTETTEDYYYETAHYAWVRDYRDQDIRDWLFAQTK